ncbi:MAG: ABC transporter substrate-binding protein [Armatimonadota bacterium]|nr:ABC transporter substrate-binding protein [Armatimonadota bacterium]MDR7421688.1 ABC transporter substrate-binding protein [Armatimonadota bacterium]MDR7454595.1 ABC transporter substrate-binding protein [Armatimonadota bacterium]MDR7456527.1 ABC transporter substrate-binding protein [Armatimonadota bacterium]MDR7495840.1 ABC transporter substrate-binding protein [Armatimonadota bacterium]
MRGHVFGTALVLAVLLALTGIPAVAQAPPPMPATIKVGALFDLTGPTSDVGVDYHKGVLDHVRYINEVQNGIRGRVRIDLVWADYAYRIPESLNLYRKYRDVDRVQAIIGWGTNDTEALKEQIAADQIPYISASYSSHLNDPSKTPYNFYPVSSYSDQIRAVLKFAREQAQRERIARPKFVFVYPDHPYGRAPIPAGKDYARELGFEVVPDQLVALTALEARAQVSAIRAAGAEFAWFGGTTNSASVTVRDAAQAGLRTRWFVNVWGYDENMIKLIGTSAEGVYGSTPHAYFGEPVPGMRTIYDAYRRFQGREVPQFAWGTTQTPYIASYIRGWLNVYLLRRGLETIVDGWSTYGRLGGFVGTNVRSALELLKNWDPEGLAPPITLARDDHRPSTTTRIMQIKGGRIVLVEQVTIERRRDWLGY